jgi:hypothetical protein
VYVSEHALWMEKPACEVSGALFKGLAADLGGLDRRRQAVTVAPKLPCAAGTRTTSWRESPSLSF